MSTFNPAEQFLQQSDFLTSVKELLKKNERIVKRIGVIFILLSGGGIGVKLLSDNTTMNEKLNKTQTPVELFLSPDQLIHLAAPNSPIISVGSGNFIDKLPPTDEPVEVTVVVTPTPEPPATETETATPTQAPSETPAPTQPELQKQNPLLITADYIDQNPQYFPKDVDGNIIINYQGTQVLVSPNALRAMKGLDGKPILLGPYSKLYPNIDTPNGFRQDTERGDIEPLAGFLVTVEHPRGTDTILAVPKKDGFFFVTCGSNSVKESFWVLDQNGKALPGQYLFSSEGFYHFDSHTISFPHGKTVQPGEPLLVWYINNVQMEGRLAKWIQSHSDNRTPEEAIGEESGNIEVGILGLAATQS